MKRRTDNLLLFAALGMSVYLSVSLAAQGRLIGDSLDRLGVTGIVAVLSLSMLNYLLRFARWQWYLRAVGARIPPARHCLYYLAGFSLTVSPGKAGEAVRSLFLKPYGVSVPTSLGALFVERLLDVSAVVLLSAFILVLKPEYRPVIGVIALLVITALVVATTGTFSRMLRALATRLPARLGAVMGHIDELLRDAAGMLSIPRVMAGLVIGVAAWGSEGFGLFLIAHTMGLNVGPGLAIGIYAMGALGGVAAFFMPGGIGGAEAALTGLLIVAGAPPSSALVVTVLCRLATLWFAVIVGLLAIALLRIRMPTKETVL